MISNKDAIKALELCRDSRTVIPTNEAIDMAIQALEEIQQYRAFEQRLKNVYGDCDGLLEVTVSSLERHENLELPCIKVKSRLIVDEDVDKWDEYRAIGSVDECREAVERMKPKKVIVEKDECISKSVTGDEDYSIKYVCPKCGSTKLKPDYPCKCGQRLDWSELIIWRD